MTCSGRRVLAITAMCACPAAATAALDAAHGLQEWSFLALLDGSPIGAHRFSVTTAPGTGERKLVSEADFTVRLLGIPVYRYRHRAVELWRGDCLAALTAETDDNGKRTIVDARAEGAQFQVSAPAPQSAHGCVMSFAYWHPALRVQERLLNAQTGQLQSVRMTTLAAAPPDVRSRSPGASGWRIGGMPQPIDVWYSAQGDWIGLDARLEGGRTLQYRKP